MTIKTAIYVSRNVKYKYLRILFLVILFFPIIIESLACIGIFGLIDQWSTFIYQLRKSISGEYYNEKR